MFSFACCPSSWMAPQPLCPSFLVPLAFQEQAGDLGSLAARLLLLAAKVGSAGCLQTIKRTTKAIHAKSVSARLGTVYASYSLKASNKLSPCKDVSPTPKRIIKTTLSSEHMIKNTISKDICLLTLKEKRKAVFDMLMLLFLKKKYLVLLKGI